MTDFELYLKETKISEQQLIDWMSYMDKYYYIDIPCKGFYISNSDIHGKGLFATNDMEHNTVVGVAAVGTDRTSLARYANHSKTPNVEFIKIEDNIVAYTLRNISKDEELTVDYRHKKIK